MSVVRVGSTGSYAEGWDFVFGSAKTQQRVTKTKGRAAAGKKTRKPTAKAAATKAAGKSKAKARKVARKKKASKRA